MTYTVYILHSSKLNKFYTGSSELAASERLELHLNKYYGDNKYTSKTDDWKLFLAIDWDQSVFLGDYEIQA